METSVRPPALRAGDTVAIVPTARAITLDELRDGIALLEAWGLQVQFGAGIGRKHFQQAGTDAGRAADLQAAINDPHVRAIWCARGGYGTVRLLDHVDLAPLRNDPKWVIGFSDITVLHNALHRLGIASLHAQMPFNIGERTSAAKDTLRAALFGAPLFITSTTTDAIVPNRVGTAEGNVVGGNLSVLYSLRGTPWDLDPRGKILVLEDLDELLYHVDRMARNLHLGGWFKELAGLVVGGMTDMHDRKKEDPFGTSADQIIAEVTATTRYPIAYGFPFGHIADNRALLLGQKAKLSVTANGATLSFEEAGAGA